MRWIIQEERCAAGVIAGFRRDANEICALLRFYADHLTL